MTGVLCAADCPSVTEEGLFHLRRCKHLLSLDISYLRSVTDNVLDRLHDLPLKQLHLAEGYLGPAPFTGEGVTRSVVTVPLHGPGHHTVSSYRTPPRTRASHGQ